MQKVLPPDPEIGWIDSKTVKLNGLTLGIRKMSLFLKKEEYSFKTNRLSGGAG